MDQDREVDRIMMNIKQGTGTAGYLLLLSVRANMMLFTFLLRLVKKGLLARGLADGYKDFLQRTEGNFRIYNIPVGKESADSLRQLHELDLRLQDPHIGNLEKTRIHNKKLELKEKITEFGELERLKIEHYIMPKLNGAERTIQVAIPNKDEQRFKNWFLNHLLTNLSGGEKDLEEIKAMTEGNYSIFNLPFEGEELKTALSDFDILGMNYTVLPDLKVNDGNSQIAIPNTDRDKLYPWFQLWKEKQIAQGQEPGDMYEMSQGSYVATGEMDQGDYIANTDRKYQEVNEEFEKTSRTPPWSEQMKHENSEEYVKYLQDDNYERITINKETLGGDMAAEKAFHEKMKDRGFFSSYIPGTQRKQRLILPIQQVFSTDEGKTYVAFLPRNGGIQVQNGDKVVTEGFEAVYQHYDKVERGLNKVKEITKDVIPEKTQKTAALEKKKTGPANRFNNFQGRNYNMKELEKKLIQR